MAAAATAGPAAPRTKTKKKQKRFVPQRVKVPRAADPLLAVLAWGVNHQVRPCDNGTGPRPNRLPPGPGLPAASPYRSAGSRGALVGVSRPGASNPPPPPPPIPTQINELSQVPPPVMLLPDDFKASSKIKVNNHLFNR